MRLIHVHRIELVQAHLLTPAVYGGIAALLHGIPLVCTFHGQVELTARGRLRPLKVSILNRAASRVVFVSEPLRKFFLSQTALRPARAMVIPNGIDVGAFSTCSDRSLRAEWGIRSDEFLVGAVGHVRPSKAFPIFLEAAAMLLKRDRHYRFVLVAPAAGEEYEQLTTLSQQLGLADRVTFAGFHEDIPRVMCALDAYVTTSTDEGFSLSTAEAMAAGVPVVATRSGGPESLITDGIHGLLAPVGRPDGVAAQVERLRADEDLRRRVTAEARRRSVSELSMDTMIASYDDLYATTLSAPQD
jgi:glycosyltransferase involved in cell wall biosynthesis